MHEGDDTPRKLLVMFSTALVVESPKRCNEYIILLLLVPPPVYRSGFFCCVQMELQQSGDLSGMVPVVVVWCSGWYESFRSLLVVFVRLD